MTDITGDLDLLGDWLDAKGYTEEAGLCTKAMDEINRQQEKLNGMLHCSEAYDAMAKLCSETEWTLKEEIARLREALAFYADETNYHSVVNSDGDIKEGMYYRDNAGDRARAAMGETE